MTENECNELPELNENGKENKTNEKSRDDLHS